MDNTKNSSNKDEMNAVLQLPDFASFNVADFHKYSPKGILGVNKLHFFIYLGTFIVSMLLIIPYGFDSTVSFYSILMSVGASGVGAAVLGYLIDMASQRNEKIKSIQEYNASIITIYYDLWLLFGNQSYEFMKSMRKDNGQNIFVNQRKDNFLMQIHTVSPKIDSFIFTYGLMHDEYTIGFFQELKTQLVHFNSSLQNTSNIDDLIITIEGIRVCLRKHFETPKIIKLFVK